MKKLLENLVLNPVVFKAVYYTLLDIESEVLTDSDGIIETHRVIFLPLRFDSSEESFLKEDPKRHRIDALMILCRHGIIRFHAFEHPFDSNRPPISNFPSGRIWIYVNDSKQFKEITKRMRAIFEQKYQGNQDTEMGSLHPLKNGKRFDEDVALRGNHLLLHARGEDFKERVKIEHLAAKLLRFLFKRKNHRASIDELRGAMGFQTSHQIYHLRDHINRVCKTHGIKKNIVIKIQRGHWGLNPELSEINKKINKSLVNNLSAIPV